MQNEVIRTLGLYQPFASLMLHGKIETRLVTIDWKPPFPLGKYLIYSTKKFYHPEDCKHVMGNYYDYANRILHNEKFHEPTIDLRGYALCLGDLVSIADPIRPCKETFVDLPAVVMDIHNYPAWRRVGLVFENMKRIKPFPFKGKQGIGFLSDADKDKIKFV